MSEEQRHPKENDVIKWVGLGVLGGLTICLCITTLVLVSMMITRAETGTSSQPVPTGEGSGLAEQALENLSSVKIPIAHPPDIAERLLGLTGIPDVVQVSPADLALGTRESFWMTNVDNNATRSVTAELVAITPHVYFWIEEGISYDLDDVNSVLVNFERSTYPKVRGLIGSEWSPGVDGDAHLYILYAGEMGSSVAGLFFSKDEYSSLAHEFSNEHEMFYINADTVRLGDAFIANLLAHEFQHMVHWNLDRNEDTWLNEGMSELVEHLLGFEIGGFDYLYAQDTDIPLQDWPSQPGSSGEHYGQTFLFMTYLHDRFGDGAIRMIAQNPANGLRSIEEMLDQVDARDPVSGDALSLTDLILNWGVSLLIQDPEYQEGHFGLRSYRDAPRAQLTERFSECPLEGQNHQVSQFGFDFFQIDCVGAFELLFSGDPFTKVISADPRTGNYAFWSNKGDSSNMTLTRQFDFREVDGPIFFEFWTWYQIEEDYDYVYLEASTDGGDTWQILRTPSGTGEDPSGNSYGWAYNGASGNRESPEWIFERVDLSAYSGGEVMLRFEYITDTAVNTEGFLLDDLTIEAVGYQQGFERGNGAWIADGFVRFHNLIPQSYQLAIIERGTELQVRKFEVAAGERMNIPLDIAAEAEEVFLVVTATSPYSWMPASYQIQIVK